ncbi:MAG: DnaJ domain-containing protein [Acidobacteriota bacterium]
MESAAAGTFEDRELTPDEIELLAGLVIEERDHYTILGIERAASASEINTAYCRAVEFFHPLKYRHLLESDNILHWKLSCAYLRVVEAFSTLSSRSRRQAYDGTMKRQIIGSLRTRERGQSATGSSLIASSMARAKASSAKPQPLNGRERRRVERVQLCLPLVVVFERHWQEVTETIDVSPLGVKFRLSRPIELGTFVRLELPMPSNLRTRADDHALTP